MGKSRGLVVVTAAPVVLGVVVMVALVVLFFARGPVPWPGSLRCSWPCCRLSSPWSCWLSPVRIAAGGVVPVAQVVPVAGKEQGGRVILRQVPGLDPAAGLLVVGVAVVAVVALAALLFARGPVPWSGSLRCSWPCCLPPVRIAAGVVVPVGVVVAQVVPVAGKEQGGRVIRGPGCSLLCPWPCALVRLAALFLALLPAVVGAVLVLVAGTDRGRGRRACRCGPVVVPVVARPFISLVKTLFLLKD